ncbi:glycosyltransferase [Bordetella petrii]|uniref:Glycosyltransferase n=1 Tax=Bordetella petrii (strain ATCC BAA-461 / DSM 12804 / CCUG 43448 / CIP 107267 / Se-1111R) TaxID=340100 RepID=A9IG69_BORPD|nr:glycosyltransferase [Bordetella petrii]CAP41864.1 glycosyltransferase [Bordetella petrii]
MADTPPHLCLLGDANSPHTRRWATEMRARGWRVSLVTARPEPLDGVEQRILPPVRHQTDWLLRAGAAQRHVHALAPDIVHAHYLTSYGYLAARCGRHPLVMTAWGSDLLVTPHRSPWMRWLTGWILRRADLVTGDSESLVEAARQYRPRAPVHEIHWGVDRARFAPAPWENKSGLQIVSLRAWEPNYHIDTLIDACALLRQRLPGAPLTLHLLGGGSLEPALRARVQERGLAQCVAFHGRLDDAGMASVLARCKISVSVPASDATSVAMLESMACGLAVVASDLAANRQWIAPDLLVPAGDARALADVLQRLADDDAYMHGIGIRNAERIALDGDRKAQMDQIDRLYRQLLK